jgi:microcompartment protein CcmK/EutM
MLALLPQGASASSSAFTSFLVRMAALTKPCLSASTAVKDETGMIIARILGTVVASQKDERLLGKKLLIVRPINVDGSDTTGYVVAVDTVGAGFHERVLVVAGSSARLAQGLKDVPVDAAIVGVIDTVDVTAPE